MFNSKVSKTVPVFLAAIAVVAVAGPAFAKGGVKARPTIERANTIAGKSRISGLEIDPFMKGRDSRSVDPVDAFRTNAEMFAGAEGLRALEASRAPLKYEIEPGVTALDKLFELDEAANDPSSTKPERLARAKARSNNFTTEISSLDGQISRLANRARKDATAAEEGAELIKRRKSLMDRTLLAAVRATGATFEVVDGKAKVERAQDVTDLVENTKGSEEAGANLGASAGVARHGGAKGLSFQNARIENDLKKEISSALRALSAVDADAMQSAADVGRLGDALTLMRTKSSDSVESGVASAEEKSQILEQLRLNIQKIQERINKGVKSPEDAMTLHSFAKVMELIANGNLTPNDIASVLSFIGNLDAVGGYTALLEADAMLHTVGLRGDEHANLLVHYMLLNDKARAYLHANDVPAARREAEMRKRMSEWKDDRYGANMKDKEMAENFKKESLNPAICNALLQQVPPCGLEGIIGKSRKGLKISPALCKSAAA